MVDSDPPCPWRANEERESLPMVPAWATDSEIGAPWEEPPLTHPPAKTGLQPASVRMRFISSRLSPWISIQPSFTVLPKSQLCALRDNSFLLSSESSNHWIREVCERNH